MVSRLTKADCAETERQYREWYPQCPDIEVHLGTKEPVSFCWEEVDGVTLLKTRYGTHSLQICPPDSFAGGYGYVFYDFFSFNWLKGGSKRIERRKAKQVAAWFKERYAEMDDN